MHFLILLLALSTSSQWALGKSIKPLAEKFPYRLETWATGLTVPWQIVFSNDKAYFTQRNGVISVVLNGRLQREPWAKLQVSKLRGEGGLLGIALHPNFEENGKLFATYTLQKKKKTINRLVVFTQVKEKNAFYGKQMKILLDDIPGGNNHNGGTLKIGPDELLYWSIGDKYSDRLSQNLNSYNGKILRLTLTGAIPKNNPFPGSYIFSSGHRNPQGIAFHPEINYGFFSTEHGPSGSFHCCRDELNWVEAGKNYGWPTISGNEISKNLETPLIHSGNAYTWAPGGTTLVLHGAWKNSLLFTGLRGMALYRVTFANLDKLINNNGKLNKKPIVESLYSYLNDTFGRLRDIAAGPNGHYYLLTSNRDGRGSPKKGDDKILRFKIPKVSSKNN